jgi:hypothetical protein
MRARTILAPSLKKRADFFDESLQTGKRGMTLDCIRLFVSVSEHNGARIVDITVKCDWKLN